MKRIHVHVSVEKDLPESVRFYSTLFGSEPGVLKADYAKWALSDPLVNFAISLGRAPGLDHLGIQVETPAKAAKSRTASPKLSGPSWRRRTRRAATRARTRRGRKIRRACDGKASGPLAPPTYCMRTRSRLPPSGASQFMLREDDRLAALRDDSLR